MLSSHTCASFWQFGGGVGGTRFASSYLLTHAAALPAYSRALLTPTPSSPLLSQVLEGKTGFHMGAFDPDDLIAEDADAVATTMARAAQVFSTPLYKQMVANCIGQDLSWAKPARR